MDLSSRTEKAKLDLHPETPQPTTNPAVLPQAAVDKSGTTFTREKTTGKLSHAFLGNNHIQPRNRMYITFLYTGNHRHS